jgi:hypothetical protein
VSAEGSLEKPLRDSKGIPRCARDDIRRRSWWDKKKTVWVG